MENQKRLMRQEWVRLPEFVEPAVTFTSVSSDLIRTSRQTGGQMLTDNPRFKWGLHWRQTANQPAAVEARVSSLHCPSPFSPTALFHRQNPFQAALLCSKHSALCAMGEGSPAGRETAIAVTATAARAPFWKGYVLTNILMSSWLKCIITYYVRCV